MNSTGHLQILCALLLAFQGVFCNEFDTKYPRSTNARDEISSGDFFKFLLRNSKQRRSVRAVGHGQVKTGDLEQTPHVKPQYECGDLVLTVILKHANVKHMFIYGLRGDMLRLGLLAASCGVSIKTTDKNVRLLFKYDSCYVKKMATQNVLSMKWYGTDIELSCPVSVPPPSVKCKGNAMELTVGNGTADELFVVLNEKEAPLLYVATQCWHRELSKKGELTLSVPYTSCGVSFRDGNYIVDLRSKDKLMPLSCPNKRVTALQAKDFEFPVKGVYDKPPSVVPSTLLASQTVKQEHAVPVTQQGPDADGTPVLQPRAYWLPKLPSLPGSFNLSVNFPFSVPMPKPLEHHRGHWMSKPVASIPEPTPEPTATFTVEEFETSDENGQPQTDSNGDYEQTEQEPVVPVTESPPSRRHHHMHHPHFFQKPTLISSQTEVSPSYQYQVSRMPLPNTPQYQPVESAQNYNIPRHNAHNVDHVLASLARYLPPGYSICPIQSPALPQMFQPSVSPPAQPLHHHKPNYRNPDITPYGALHPAVPPIKGFSEERLASPDTFSHHHHHHSRTPISQPTQLFQPSQYQPYWYQSSYGRQGPTTTFVSPSSSLNLPFQTRPLNPSNPFQVARPFQSQYHQKPSQPGGSVQQPWSAGLPGQSRTSSRHLPEYLRYQTVGQQSLDLDRRSWTPGTGLSSQSQYQPSQFSRFPYPLKPEVLSSYVSAENTDSRTKGFFQPRSLAEDPSVKSQSFTGTRPAKSVLPFFGQQGAQLPYRQGPSIGQIQNPYVDPESLSEPNRQ